MWVATYRGICKPWGILSLWNSNCCHIGFLGTIKRKRLVDWNTSWCFCSNNHACYNNKKYKLG
ncbi:hypothetical protein ACSBR1_036435 [Camellia fascicularis]